MDQFYSIIWYCIFSIASCLSFIKDKLLRIPILLRLLINEINPNPKINYLTNWMKNGTIHRDGAPATTVYLKGDIVLEAYYVEGVEHRENAPALICYHNNSRKRFKEVKYFNHGKLHREDGPAAIFYYLGTRYWYLDNRSIPEEFYDIEVKKRSIELRKKSIMAGLKSLN